MGHAEEPDINNLLRRAVELHTDEIEEYDQFLKLSNQIRTLDVDVLQAIKPFLVTGSPNERAAMVDLVSRYSFEARKDLNEACFQILLKHVDVETDSSVISVTLTALAHLQDERSIPVYLRFVDHMDENVRFAVAQALPIGTNFADNPAVISALVKLSADTDSDVRDWACFGLGQLDADGVEVRAALGARLYDEDEDTKDEALSALAGLADQRVVPLLLELLSKEDVWPVTIEAAGKIANTDLHPLLLAIRKRAIDPKNFEALDFAIRRCAPQSRELANQWEQSMFTLLITKASKENIATERSGEYPLTSLKAEREGQTVYEGRIWDYKDPVEAPSPDVESDSWMLTIQNSIAESV